MNTTCLTDIRCTYSVHVETHLRHAIDPERFAADHVEHLALLVRGQDCWIGRGVGGQVRLVGGGPNDHATLLIGE
jgi:hypothetical protein